MPGWAASGVSRSLPIGELVMGGLLIAGWNAPVISGVSAVLFFAFAALVGRATVRDSLKGAGCGCFGARAQTSGVVQTNGPQITARNFLLGNVALIAAFAGHCACAR